MEGGPPAALLWSLALCHGKIGVGFNLSCLHPVSCIQCPGPGWRGTAAHIRVSEDCAVAEWKVTVTVTAPTHSLCFLGRLLQQLTLQTLHPHSLHTISTLFYSQYLYSTLQVTSIYCVLHSVSTSYSIQRSESNLNLLYLHYSSHTI